MCLSVGGGDISHCLLTIRGVQGVPCGLEEALTDVCVQGGVVCLFHCALGKSVFEGGGGGGGDGGEEECVCVCVCCVCVCVSVCVCVCLCVSVCV